MGINRDIAAKFAELKKAYEKLFILQNVSVRGCFQNTNLLQKRKNQFCKLVLVWISKTLSIKLAIYLKHMMNLKFKFTLCTSTLSGIWNQC